MTLDLPRGTKAALLIAVASAVAGCAGLQREQQAQHGAPLKEAIHAVTSSNQLVKFNAGQPGKILSSLPLAGLQKGEVLLGIDYRVAKGWLYGLGSSGRLYRINTGNGAVTMVGSAPVAIMPTGPEVGFDFNPTVDRIRVVSNSKGENMRLHPDTGAVVDGDPNAPGVQVDGTLSYAPGDTHAGKVPAIVAAGYSYNKQDEKITTNFAIDAQHRALVTQGSREGVSPAVSPNTGRLYTVGALGTGPMEKVSFDIADVSGAAFMAASGPGEPQSSWYVINLDNGKATRIGTIATTERVVGFAVEP
ncbi:DUF4394 domain-containing protein [Noviherbaspirillum sp. CPCC 100848]|uniref:DUF4394 domain-containing protein n=1 Tax=Noviherbaspirillum album TaxID=3080276 RepID=A0ABU6J8A1_9BURK|nr:DUF4394 domain-containing protein [Noviherbaspirillum sp. CPCC 100848]MEC4719885.1 DUF4394 domain-containing protein [Noviherbaspirillum sp. CPCC 100848]